MALPGVQVLFAFLLIVPFQQRFAEVSDVSRLIYFAGLAASAASIAFFIAPATYHRLNLRRGTDEKEQMLLTSNRLAIIGTGFVAAGMTCSVYIVADLMFGSFEAIIAAVITAVVFSILWYGLPLAMRRGGGELEDGA